MMLLLFGGASLWADYIKVTTVGCPSIDILKRLPQETANDYVKVNLFAMTNDCVILTREDAIEAIDYDPANEKTLYIKILYKKTGATLFVLRDEVLIEQPGKKNRFRF